MWHIAMPVAHTIHSIKSGRLAYRDAVSERTPKGTQSGCPTGLSRHGADQHRQVALSLFDSCKADY